VHIISRRQTRQYIADICEAASRTGRERIDEEPDHFLLEFLGMQGLHVPTVTRHA